MLFSPIPSVDELRELGREDLVQLALAACVERTQLQQKVHELNNKATVASLEDGMAERYAALEADNAKLRAELDEATSPKRADKRK